jgi:hypothetical protein
MDWVFELYQEYLLKEAKKAGISPTQTFLKEALRNALQEGSVKIMVQEPWMGTIRFKTLAHYPAVSEEAFSLYKNPMEYLRTQYGGGKFKINFYRGMHFIATKNFKPEGEPLWTELPEVVEE